MSLKALEARLDEARADVDRAREVARSRDNHEDKIVEALQANRKEREDIRKVRQAAKKEIDKLVSDKADVDEETLARLNRVLERTADKVESLEADADRLVEQLERVSRRSKAAKAELRKERKRVKRIRARIEEREEAIEENKGKLSDNFYRYEFNCREGDPCPTYMDPHLKQLCNVFLEELRDQFGACHVNSGHRWEFYNIKIGGATGSYHEYEQRREDPAADCTFATGTPAQWAAAARNIANRLGFGGVGQYNNSGFVHIDTGPRRDWWG